MSRIRFVTWLVIMSFGFAPHSVAADTRILDRLVIEIEKTSFTQRHLELYAAAKAIVVEDAGNPELVNAENYRTQLERYGWDMVVEHEAARLGSFQPDRKAILIAKEKWDQAVAKNPELQEFVRRMACDQETARVVAATVLRVRNFILSKERQNSQGKSPQSGILDPKAEWFVRLEQRTAYRIFGGARDYQKIDPSI